VDKIILPASSKIPEANSASKKQVW
jgi:hypothetical protein